jgi:hypothetical protein
MNTNNSQIASMAATLLGLLMNEANAMSDPAALAEATRIHETERAYPKLTVTMPHGGGAIRLELVLCDPRTDEPLVSMFTGEAEANGPAWSH